MKIYPKSECNFYIETSKPYQKHHLNEKYSYKKSKPLNDGWNWIPVVRDINPPKGFIKTKDLYNICEKRRRSNTYLGLGGVMRIKLVTRPPANMQRAPIPMNLQQIRQLQTI